MADEPTSGELLRALDRHRQDIRDELRQLRDEVRQAVSRDVYRSDERMRDQQLRDLEQAIGQVSEKVDANIRTTQDWRDRRDEARKWLIGLVILPIGGVVAQIAVAVIVALRSGH